MPPVAAHLKQAHAPGRLAMLYIRSTAAFGFGAPAPKPHLISYLLFLIYYFFFIICKAALCFAQQQPLFTACQLSVFIDPASFFRHGVKAEFAKRVAAQNAPQRQKQALEQAVGLQCLYGIVAAGRDKPAMPARVCADVFLVKADQRHQQAGHGAAGGTGAALSGRPALANSLPSVLLSCVLFKRGV